MKSSIYTALVFVGAIASAAAMACGTITGDYSGRGSSSVQSNAATAAVANGAGSSFSFGANTQDATTSYTGFGGGSHSGKKDDLYLGGNANAQGVATTSGMSTAYNVSTGSGSGSAGADGTARADVAGSASFQGRNTYGKISGAVDGNAKASTADGVSASTNQGGVTGGTSVAGFAQDAAATLKGQTLCSGGSSNCVRSVQQNATTLSNSFATNTSFTGSVMNGGVPLNAATSNVSVDAKAGGSVTSKVWSPKQ